MYLLCFYSVSFSVSFLAKHFFQLLARYLLCGYYLPTQSCIYGEDFHEKFHQSFHQLGLRTFGFLFNLRNPNYKATTLAFRSLGHHLLLLLLLLLQLVLIDAQICQNYKLGSSLVARENDSFWASPLSNFCFGFQQVGIRGSYNSSYL